jgi:carboxyl-terminal processing protease
MPRFTLRGPKGLIALAGLIAIGAVVVGAQAPDDLKPSEFDQDAAKIVARLLERDHLAHPTIDDAVSEKWARNYLKMLDPLKYYFLKADVDEFLAQDKDLDDQVKKGDLSFGTEVFKRFLQRSDERLLDAREILTEKPDFDVDESMVDDPDRLDWPKDHAEAKDRLRKLIKYDLLLRTKINKDDDEKAIEKLLIRYKDRNRMYKQFNSSELLELYLTALTTVIDPHTTYMSGRNFEDMMNQQLHLTLDGIGASLSTEDGIPVVKEIVPGGAADKDGRLQPEDKIVGIEEADGTRQDFTDKKLSDVVRVIRGPRGTHIKLVVQPEDSKEEKIYELIRQKIDLNEGRAKGQIIEAKTDAGNPVKVGVVSLPAFYGDPQAVREGKPDARSATKDCRDLIDGFKKDGIDVVLVDLRGNGGGLLPEAITLSGLFIDKGPVVQVRDAARVRHLDDDDEGTAWDGPLAVLIDHYSASASEIFAGVIKDYRRGLIIGDSSTYGKGTVQSIVDINELLRIRGQNIPSLGALKLTIQQFYRPDGESTQIRGVVPDVPLPTYRDAAEIGEGRSDSALKFDKVAPLPHDMYNRVPSDLVQKLADRSEARRKDNKEFQEQAAAIKRYTERKARHEISLNEAKFRAETAAEDDEDPEKAKKNEPKKRRAERNAWEPSFINDEIMNIVADYVRLGGNVLLAAPVHEGQTTPDARPQMP